MTVNPTLQLNAQIGIVGYFDSQTGFPAMSRVNEQVVLARDLEVVPQLAELLQRSIHCRQIAAQVCPTDRSGKQHVTAEQTDRAIVLPEQIAAASSGVAWCVHDIEPPLSIDLNGLTVNQQLFGWPADKRLADLGRQVLLRVRQAARVGCMDG